jgi:hypothetical protein
VLAEVLDDVAVLLVPVDAATVRERLDGIRGAAVLCGVRGSPGADLEALAALVSGLVRLLVERPDILEVDLNPVIAGPAGCVAVDALVVLQGGAPA